MMEGVGRRLGSSSGSILNIGTKSLNGRERNVLFRNDGSDLFTEVGWVNGVARIEDGRGLALLDYDDDGSLDIVLRNFRTPSVLLKNRGDKNHWIRFDLTGTKSNRDAVGARIRIRTGSRWQTRVVSAGSGYISAGSRRQHFGLGKALRVDHASIEWPSGEHTVLTDLEVDRVYAITEATAEAISE